MCNLIARRLLPLLGCLLGLVLSVPVSAARAADDQPADRKTLDQQIYKTLRDVINKGADLYNAGDQNGCYRFYEGALVALQPFLEHRPEMQKAITDGIDNARRNPELARRAFVLRDVIDQIRNDIHPKKPEDAGKKPDDGVKPPTPAGGKTLWDRLGGEANVKQVVDDFVEIAGQDSKVNFDRSGKYALTEDKIKLLKQMIVEWISANTGGPYKKYTGKDMKTVHAGMGITDEQFNASKDDLKKALDRNGARPEDVKAVLAIVERARKDIVEKKAEAPKEDAEKTATISGKVLFSGKPLAAGKVVFHPEEGKPTTGEIKEDGTYSVKSLLPGKYTLTIEALALPEKYSDPAKSGLQLTVVKGNQTHDLDLAK
jgi:hemoglobin